MMQKRIPQHAIAFYDERIDHFERAPNGVWSLADRLQFDGHDESAIAKAFAARTHDWQKLGKAVLCWFPANLAQMFRFDSPRTDREILSDYLKAEHVDHAEIVVFPPLEPESGKSDYLVVEQKIYQEIDGFLVSEGYEIAGASIAPDTSEKPTPILFSTDQMSEVASADISSKASAANIPQSDDVTNSSASAPSQSQKRPVTRTGTSSNASNKYVAVFVGLAAIFGGIAYFRYNPDSSTPTIAPEETQVKVAQEEPVKNVEPTPVEPPQVVAAPDPEAVEEVYSGGFPVAEFTYPDRPSDQAARAEAFSAEQPNIVVGLSDVSFVDRPENQDKVFSEYAKTQANESPSQEGGKPVVNSDAEAAATTSSANGSDHTESNEDDTDTAVGIPPKAIGNVATLQGAFDLQSISVLGIFGPSGKPKAMIRSAGGRVQEVSKGDKVDGWQIVAISRKEVILNKSGQQRRLSVPGD